MQLSWPAQDLRREAGASERELTAMSGWENADMARVHTGKAAQKKLGASEAAKLSLSEIIVPPAVAPIKNTKHNYDLESGWCPRPDSNQHALAGNRF